MRSQELNVRSDQFSFGSLTIDGKEYDYDLVIDRGHVAKRKKKASKKYRHEFGHTPLSLEENIPWKCSQLVIGIGAYDGYVQRESVERLSW